MNARSLNLAAGILLVSLIALCVLWEAWLAPLRPGGSWMTLKALPLMGALFGVLKGRRYTYQWLSMLVLLYLVEGVVRATDAGLTGALAIGEAVIAALLFVAALLYARVTAPSRQTRAS
ncbi:DUF2069 domain-containing protein [Azoarcus sp. KH32C]|uniref:DUF2069 domain-containing protein n=1 Tax=Azoarcus sp. KH32C TaxID=748247 RepID=UPI0002386439|nr:DUF2069 domain-containing protein [Azoarcus sp. KH32C]BAL25768.1 hypothetical protein AZKH_3479 [Azoarcus sp. KH32C]